MDLLRKWLEAPGKRASGQDAEGRIMVRRGVVAGLAYLVAVAFLGCPRMDAPAPRLWVSADTISFELGDTHAAFLVRNDGPEGSILNFQVQANVPWLKVEPAVQFGVKAHMSRAVTVSLDESAMATKTRHLGRLSVSALGAPQFDTVSVQADVDLAPPPAMHLYPNGTLASWPIRLLPADDEGCLLLCASSYYGYSSLDRSYIVRVDKTGDPLWLRSYDESSSYTAACRGGDDRYALAGTRYEEGDAALLLTFVGLDGAILDSRTYTGFGWPGCANVIPQPDGGFVLAIEGIGDTTRVPYFMKVDSAGNEQWRRSFPGNPGFTVIDAEGTANSLQLLGRSGSGYRDILLLRTDEAGVEQSRTICGSGLASPRGIAVCDGRGTALAGMLGTQPGLLTLGAQGLPLWSCTIDPFSRGALYDALPLADGGYLVVGTTAGVNDYYGYSVAGTGAALVARITAGGFLLWANEYGGTCSDSAVDAIATDDGFAVVGATHSYGPGRTTPFLIFLDQDGNVLAP